MASLPIRTHGSNLSEDVLDSPSHASGHEHNESNKDSSDVGDKLPCSVCNKYFDTEEAFKVHSFIEHQYKLNIPEDNAEQIRFLREMTASFQAISENIRRGNEDATRNYEKWKEEVRQLEEEEKAVLQRESDYIDRQMAVLQDRKKVVEDRLAKLG